MTRSPWAPRPIRQRARARLDDVLDDAIGPLLDNLVPSGDLSAFFYKIDDNPQLTSLTRHQLADIITKKLNALTAPGKGHGAANDTWAPTTTLCGSGQGFRTSRPWTRRTQSPWTSWFKWAQPAKPKPANSSKAR